MKRKLVSKISEEILETILLKASYIKDAIDAQISTLTNEGGIHYSREIEINFNNS